MATDSQTGQFRVLLITHEASMTGAPLITLRLLRWLARQEEWDPVLLSLSGGSVLEQYRAVAPVISPVDPRISNRVRRLPGGKALSDRLNLWHFQRELRRKGPFDVAFSSTLTNGDWLRELLPESVPLVSRASELEHSLVESVSPSSLRYTLGRSRRVIAVSNAVRQNLVDTHEYPDTSVTVLPGFVEGAPDDADALRVAARRELGLHADAFVVGGVGTLAWNKGGHLFVQVARHCRDGMQFVRIGGAPEQVRELEYDSERSGLANTLFLRHRKDAATLIAAFDLLLVTSRVDSYPVVMLEAGALGIPTVCFSNSGGASEFTSRGGGVAVDYLDTAAMAAVVRQLCDDRARLRLMGDRARLLVTRDHTADVVAPQIAAVLAETAIEPK